MKIPRGQIFKVVSHLRYKKEELVKNVGWVTTIDHETGIKLLSSGGYLVVAECSALDDIEVCPHCCLMYGKPSNKCDHCQNLIRR